MVIKIIYKFFKELFKDREILHQNWKLGFKKARKTVKWNFLLRFFEDWVEEPESLFFVSSRHTEDKSYQEIHTLAVAYFWLVYRVGFQNILKLRLAIFAKFFTLKIWKRWKSTRYILFNIIGTSVIWLTSDFKLSFILSRNLFFQLMGDEAPRQPSILRWRPLSQTR